MNFVEFSVYFIIVNMEHIDQIELYRKRRGGQS